MNICRILMPLFVLLFGGTARAETIFVFGEEIHPVTKPVIRNGVVVITDGKIQAWARLQWLAIKKPIG